jgi:hypothetical protein
LAVGLVAIEAQARFSLTELDLAFPGAGHRLRRFLFALLLLLVVLLAFFRLLLALRGLGLVGLGVSRLGLAVLLRLVLLLLGQRDRRELGLRRRVGRELLLVVVPLLGEVGRLLQ